MELIVIIIVIIICLTGSIPLRHLVYRVHALPESMRSLVWDFGSLQPDVEERYIRQIVGRYVRKFNLQRRSTSVVCLARFNWKSLDNVISQRKVVWKSIMLFESKSQNTRSARISEIFITTNAFCLFEDNSITSSLLSKIPCDRIRPLIPSRHINLNITFLS